MNSTYDRTQINPLFNPNDYIDTSFMTKADCDLRYINANQQLETLIGSLQITGNETVQNQLVLGNEVISGTINAGVANDATKGSVITGNVTLGDGGNNTATQILGITNIGTDKDVTLKGSNVKINDNVSTGGNTVIGNATNGKSTTIPGQVNIGSVGSTNTQVNGTFYVGNGSSNIAMSGSGLSLQNATGSGNTIIGNASNTTNINGNVNLGGQNDGTVTIQGNTSIGNSNKTLTMRGTTTGINQETDSGNVTIGSNASQVSQVNTFLSLQNRIYNPLLCDQSGTVLNKSFNLNSPSFFVFARSLTTSSMPQNQGFTVYLNTPDLTNYMIFPITMEFTYYVVTGKGTGSTLSAIESDALTSSSSLNSGVNGTRHSYGVSTILVDKIGGTNNAYNFTHIPLTYGGAGTSLFSAIGFGTNSGASNITPFNFVRQDNNKIAINVIFPVFSGTFALSSTKYMPIVMGGSVRILNSVTSGLYGGFYPNNVTVDSLGGGCYFTSS